MTVKTYIEIKRNDMSEEKKLGKESGRKGIYPGNKFWFR